MTVGKQRVIVDTSGALSGLLVLVVADFAELKQELCRYLPGASGFGYIDLGPHSGTLPDRCAWRPHIKGGKGAFGRQLKKEGREQAQTQSASRLQGVNAQGQRLADLEAAETIASEGAAAEANSTVSNLAPKVVHEVKSEISFEISLSSSPIELSSTIDECDIL